MAQQELHKHFNRVGETEKREWEDKIYHSEIPGSFVFNPEEIYLTNGKEPTTLRADGAGGEFLAILGVSALTNLVLRKNKFALLATISVALLGLKLITEVNGNENILLPFPPTKGSQY